MALKISGRQGWLEILAYVVVGCLVYFLLVWQVLTEAAGSTSTAPAWANPSAKAIKRVSPIGSAQSSPNLFDNMDCTVMTYRLPASGSMGTGCFTETALGLLDSDSDIMIFNGTDEGLPLLSYSPHQVLAPWPMASDLVALDTVSTGGSFISLYKNPLAVTKDQRNIFLQLTGKQLTTPPELPITDKLGQRLVINSQTLAFSDGGSWLVAETLHGSFVRINLATLDIKPFAPAFGMSGSPALLKSRVAVSSDGRFVAINNNEASSFRVYDLSNCSVTSVNLQPEGCLSYDYLPFVKSQVAGLQSIRHVRFVNDGLLSFEANSTDLSAGGIYELAPTDSIESLIDYLGLGDSYTSGEGAFDYLAGTDSPDNMCHLSIRSYPLQLTNDLFTSRGGRSVACSGAVIKDVVSENDAYRGQVRNALDFKHLKEGNTPLLNSVLTNFVPGYIAQQRFVKQYQPAIITVSVGGDDIGFGDILEQCVGPHVSLHPKDNICFNTYEDRHEILQLVDRIYKNWVSGFKQLKAASPHSTLYAIGYPQIAFDGGNCAQNVHLSRPELEFGTELISYLDQTIEKAANETGIQYVDISQALVGHRMCEAPSYEVAVNGLTAGKDAGILGIGLLGKESYHPNALGHQLIKQSILKQTHNLTSVISSATIKPSPGKLLNAPKSGRQVTNRIPVKQMTPKFVSKGKATGIKLSGAENGLKPKTAYSLKIDGLSGQTIGTVVSDEIGDVDSIITLPTSVEPGSHSIDLTGGNQADDPIVITQPIFVTTVEDDADGDGIADSTDSCPTVINSGIDADQDGVDDACDGFIAQQPPITPPNSSSTQTNPPAIPPVNPTNTSGSSSDSTSSLRQPALTIAASLAVKKNSSVSSIGQVLGSKTISLSNQQPKNLNLGSASIPVRSKIPAIKAPRVNWLPWLLLVLCTWLMLIAVGVYFDNFAYRRLPTA